MNKSWEDPFCFCGMGAEDHPWERVRDSMKHLTIEKVIGREIIDSRGNPTVEAEVYLSDGPWEEEPHPAAHLPENLKHWS